MGLKAALQAFLDHRREVLVRRAKLPPRQDRAAAAHPRRPADRLPQSRRGDPHRPLRGRAEGQADRRLRARPTSRPTPSSTPACASWPSWRRWSCGASTPSSPRSATASRRMLASDKPAVEAGRRRRCATCAKLARAERRRSAQRRSTFADAPDDRRRGGGRGAGGARADHRHPVRAGLDPRRQGPDRGSVGAEVQGGRQAWPSWSRPRPPTSCCCSPPTAASSPWPATSCRRREGRASRCG